MDIEMERVSKITLLVYTNDNYYGSYNTTWKEAYGENGIIMKLYNELKPNYEKVRVVSRSDNGKEYILLHPDTGEIVLDPVGFEKDIERAKNEKFA